jgi:hypothetical protein
LIYEYSDDYEHHYVSERATYTNAKFNSEGFITQCDVTEESYSDSTDKTPKTESYTTNVTYTTLNRITRATYSDDSGDYDSTIYEWNNSGDLVCVTDLESDRSDDLKISYSGTQNLMGTWTYFFVSNSPEFASGYFGLAPAHLPATIVSDGETIQNSFKISAKGYIQKERVYFPGEALGMTLSYHYQDLGASAAAPAAKIAGDNKQHHHAAKSIFLRTKKIK